MWAQTRLMVIDCVVRGPSCPHSQKGSSRHDSYLLRIFVTPYRLVNRIALMYCSLEAFSWEWSSRNRVLVWFKARESNKLMDHFSVEVDKEGESGTPHKPRLGASSGWRWCRHRGGSNITCLCTLSSGTHSWYPPSALKVGNAMWCSQTTDP